METNSLLDKITAWAKSDDNVRALVLTGSQARGAEEADEYSDYDIEIIAKDYKRLAGDDAWIHSFGPVMVSLYLGEGPEYPTRLVFYQGATKVDFTLADKQRVENL